MLSKVVNIIQKSSLIKVESDLMLCSYVIDDLNVILELYDSDIIENSLIDDYKINDEIILEFSINRMLSKGFYMNVDSFLKWNYYEFPGNEIYIYELGKYLNETDSLKQKYFAILKLIAEIKNVSKYSYFEDEILNTIIVREDKSLFLSLKYSSEDLSHIDDPIINDINSFVEILQNDTTTDKKHIYLNELIDFLTEREESERFTFLIENFKKYIIKSASTFNYYLRNFSFNKLKIELDAKALDFNQKLQSVINDSQTKLIAIPTALVFVLSTLNYDDVNSIKNYLTLIGLILFNVFIQIFINNQKSAISFIEENINYYKLSYNNDIGELHKSFKKVYSERDKQLKRILQIQLLLWFVPILTITIILFVNTFKILSFLNLFIYIIISLVIYLKAIKCF